MANVETKVESNKLIITVDLTKDEGPSKTGKTLIVATTNGFQRVGSSHPEVSFGLNVVKGRR